MVKRALFCLPVLSLATEPGVVVDEIKYEFDPIGDYCEVPYYGPASYTFTNGTALPQLGAQADGLETMEQCAKLCTASSTCKSWTYKLDSDGGNPLCYDITGLRPDAPGSVKLTFQGDKEKVDPGAGPITGLAGKCNCPSNEKAGVTLTGANFPASNVSDYTKLFESSAHAPAPLACWPKDDQGKLKPAPVVVQRSNQVTQDAPNYFPGWCSGLKKQNVDFKPGMDCQNLCQDNWFCSGYQWIPSGLARPDGCYWGDGYDCWDEATGTAADNNWTAAITDEMKAERYTRGEIKAIATITKYRILKLTKRFAPVGIQDGNWDLTNSRCREVCAADLFCTVWQTYDGTGVAESGCWTESRGALDYPLDRDDTVEEPSGIMGGEFLQHWWSEDITTTTTTTTTNPPPDRMLPIMLGLAGLAALLGVGAYAMGWCSPKDKPKKPRAKRALQQPDPPKEEPKPEPVPTQPSFLMSAPVLTYSAAPVTYAAPVATMQAAHYAAPPVTTASYQVVQPHSAVPYSTSVVVPQEVLPGVHGVHGGFMG